jgi:hypothetical protein
MRNESKNSPLRIFISYKNEHEDHNRWVCGLASDLERAGFEVRLDEWDVRLGDSFTDYMTRGIRDADVVLFVITEASLKSVESNGPGGAVKFELQMATARRTAGENLRIIGIYRSGASPPIHLRDNRYADFRDDESYVHSLLTLIQELRILRPLSTQTWNTQGTWRPLPTWQPSNLPAVLPMTQYYRDVLTGFYSLVPDPDMFGYLYFGSGRTTMEIVAGRWLGVTGGMWLDVTKYGEVEGYYDWGAKRDVGDLRGLLCGNVLCFEWKWRSAAKAGNGFLLCGHHLHGTRGPFADTLELLVGGWFFDWQEVDLNRIFNDPQATVVHPWIFIRCGPSQYLGAR